MSLAVGNKLIDFSGLRPSVASLKANKCPGVFRYLAPPKSVSPASQWKIITKAEFDSYIKAGIEVHLNWEWYQGRMLEGAKAGTQDGAYAYAAARALGYAKGATIYLSHDTSTRNDLQCAAYIRAFFAAQKGYYEARAPYSGIGMVEAMHKMGLAVRIWQTLAWSNGKKSAYANVYQNGHTWYNKQADEDVVMKLPLGGHLATLAATKPVVPPKPVPKPVALPYTAGAHQNLLTDLSRRYALVINDDGSVEVHKDNALFHVIYKP